MVGAFGLVRAVKGRMLTSAQHTNGFARLDGGSRLDLNSQPFLRIRITDDVGNLATVYSPPVDFGDMSSIKRHWCPGKRDRFISYSGTFAGKKVRFSKESARETFATQPWLFHQ